MLLVRIVLLPVRLAFKSSGFAAKAGYRTGRLFGYRRLFVFLLGVGVGLLLAPVAGRELRAKLLQLVAGPESSAPMPFEPVDEVEPPAPHAPTGEPASLTSSGTNGHA